MTNAAELYGERLGLARGVSAWHDVGSVADLERDGRVIARVEGREVGVVPRRRGAPRRAQPLPAPRRPALPRARSRSASWAEPGGYDALRRAASCAVPGTAGSSTRQPARASTIRRSGSLSIPPRQTTAAFSLTYEVVPGTL